jgi:hypothetical protein
MFAYLIQQRLEEASLSSVFFDQAVRVMTNLNLNSLTGDKRNISTFIPSSTSPGDRQAILLLTEKDDAETPLHELVACFNELANTFSLSRKPPTLSDLIAKRKRQSYQRSNSHSIESFGSSESEIGTPKMMVEKRQELAQARHGLDLQLDDMGKGPLIISGPSKIEDYSSLGTSPPPSSSPPPSDEFEEAELSERPSSVRYRYSGGWPDLDASLLNSLPRNSQQGLEILRTNRIKSLKQVQKLVYLSPPSPSH